MITSLLALALAAAPDSAAAILPLPVVVPTAIDSTSTDSVAASSPVVVVIESVAKPAEPVAPPVLSSKALDSLALERVSPMPIAPMFDTARAKGPRMPIGLGFRVLGSGLGAHAHAGEPHGTHVRLQVTGSTRSDSRKEVSPSLPRESLSGATSSEEWEARFLVETLLGSRGSIDATGSMGLLGGYSISTERSMEPFYPGWVSQHERILRYGVAVTAGLRWEFLEGLFLSSEVGIHGAKRFGTSDQSVVMRRQPQDDITEVHGRIEGTELEFAFLGAGLDAWF